jgi:hypothetical protein
LVKNAIVSSARIVFYAGGHATLTIGAILIGCICLDIVLMLISQATLKI